MSPLLFSRGAVGQAVVLSALVASGNVKLSGVWLCNVRWSFTVCSKA
jgi:hypothetical protein